jgi:tetratricopeptide (TPR) repeat protein
MVASLMFNLLMANGWIGVVAGVIFTLFQLWMAIDAFRRGEWMWGILILIGWGIMPLIYYFAVYRAESSTRGFELPGAHKRKQIKELQAKIHHIGNAVHYYQLGDIYFQQGKLEKAEACYRSALEREPEDIDARAHLGQCLMREKRPAEARPLLEAVCAADPRHDYGYSLMAYAEALTALGEENAALAVWQKVTANHSYPRAKVQLAELLAAKGEPDGAKAELRDVLSDDVHAPAFQRKRDRVWVRRARRLAGKLPG